MPNSDKVVRKREKRRPMKVSTVEELSGVSLSLSCSISLSISLFLSPALTVMASMNWSLQLLVPTSRARLVFFISLSTVFCQEED